MKFVIIYLALFSMDLYGQSFQSNNACLIFTKNDKSTVPFLEFNSYSRDSNISVDVKHGYITKDCPGGTSSLFFKLSSEYNSGKTTNLTVRTICLSKREENVYKAILCYHAKRLDYQTCSEGKGISLGFYTPAHDLNFQPLDLASKPHMDFCIP